MSEKLSFVCYLAGVNSSAKPLSIDREGNGRLVLEFSSSDKNAVLKLLDAPYNEAALHITVTPDGSA